MRSVPVKPYPESEHIILECECDEKLVILGFEDDWRSRQAVFKCECGNKISLDDHAGEETLAVM